MPHPNPTSKPSASSIMRKCWCAATNNWTHKIATVYYSFSVISMIVGQVGGLFGPPPPRVKESIVPGIRIAAQEDAPWYGLSNATFSYLQGEISGFDPNHLGNYVIVAYTFAWNSGGEIGYWYVQPFKEDCHTQIGPSKMSWVTHVRRGYGYGVLLAKRRTGIGAPHPGPLAGPQPVWANGCSFPSKLLTFPPEHADNLAWQFIRGPTPWTGLFEIGWRMLALGLVVTAGAWLGLKAARIQRKDNDQGGFPCQRNLSD